MPVSTSLRGRVPGQAAMAEIVEVQRAVPPRSLAARLFGVSPLTPASRGLYRAALSGGRDPKTLWRDLKALGKYGVTRGPLNVL